MTLTILDWAILISFFVVAIVIGVAVSRQAGENSSEFFLSGRHMPWWLLGFSMVATTFSTDTPNLVTDLVRERGVSGNWAWWAFLITGLVTVFFYAKLWRRSSILTDLELYEIRYSGKSATFLRGFRALYLGVFINVLIMATVSLAAIKIGETMLGWNRYQSVSLAMIATVIFSSLGGFKGVILTDFVLFILSIVGSFAAAYFAVVKVGGLSVLLSNPEVAEKLSFFPPASSSTSLSDDSSTIVGVLVIPLLVQWWSAWYPGAEPGGGGYLAQRMLAAKNEKHAVGAVFFFQVVHYAVRPWPWILVALCSIVVFPTIEDIQSAFPQADNVANDSGYSAMLTFLPPGWFGLVLTSLVAAYMSTISTHLNWGASYVVNDFWKQYVQPDASEKQLVWVGRLSTVVMMLSAALVAFQIEKASDAFGLLVALGAGSGGVLLARWFWWRVNAISEIVAILTAAVVCLTFQFSSYGKQLSAFLGAWAVALQVGIVTAAWLITIATTKPTDFRVLKRFVEITNPGGPGWHFVFREATRRGETISVQGEAVNFTASIVATILASIFVYGQMFAFGYLIYGNTSLAIVWLFVASAAGVGVGASWRKLRI